MALNKQEIKKYARIELREIPYSEFDNLVKESEHDSDIRYSKFSSDGNVYCYEYEVPTDDELDTALLYKLCKSQDETNKHLKVIKGVLIFFAALTIIGMIAAVVLLNK